MILVVTVLVVAASYYGFSRFDTGAAAPASANAVEQTASTTVAAAVPPAGAGAPVVPSGTIAITISKAHPPAPSDVIRVSKDDPVTLAITSDHPGHLEVHGYKKEVKLEPGTTAMLSFTAERTGRFPIDLHGSDGAHLEVTALEVLPR